MCNGKIDECWRERSFFTLCFHCISGLTKFHFLNLNYISLISTEVYRPLIIGILIKTESTRIILITDLLVNLTRNTLTFLSLSLSSANYLPIISPSINPIIHYLLEFAVAMHAIFDNMHNRRVRACNHWLPSITSSQTERGKVPGDIVVVTLRIADGCVALQTECYSHSLTSRLHVSLRICVCMRVCMNVCVSYKYSLMYACVCVCTKVSMRWDVQTEMAQRCKVVSDCMSECSAVTVQL